jgi:hypothetical protein
MSKKNKKCRCSRCTCKRTVLTRYGFSFPVPQFTCFTSARHYVQLLLLTQKALQIPGWAQPISNGESCARKPCSSCIAPSALAGNSGERACVIHTINSTPLHPDILIPFLHIRISRFRSRRLNISILYHLQSTLYTSHPYVSFRYILSGMFYFPLFLLPLSILGLYHITHKPSTFPNNLQVLLLSGKLISMSVFPLSLCWRWSQSTPCANVFSMHNSQSSLCTLVSPSSMSSTVHFMYPYSLPFSLSGLAYGAFALSLAVSLCLSLSLAHTHTHTHICRLSTDVEAYGAYAQQVLRFLAFLVQKYKF